jgi:uncharacterized membrane protein
MTGVGAGVGGLLPSGTTLPPTPYLVGVLGALAVLVVVLYRRSPRVTGRVVVGLAPWMAAGAGLYALRQVEAVPAVLAPLTGSPTVYLTTAIVAGSVWALVADAPVDSYRLRTAPGTLLVTGSLALWAVLLAAIAVGGSRRTLTVVWPGIALVVGVVLGTLVWFLVRRYRPVQAARVGTAGLLVVVGHALDAVSTTVGLEVLGFSEQTPLSAFIFELAADLPTAALLGEGWLFVVVKLALAVGVALLLADYVREDPDQGNLLLAFVAAVGLGPGFHNVVLFAIAGG